MQRPDFPAPGDRRQDREERKEAKRRGVRGGQIEPSGRPDFPPLPVERDEKIRAQREEFPPDEKLQPVRRNKGHPHEEQHDAPPKASTEGRAGVFCVRPVFARIDCSGRTQDSEQRQEKRADPVEPEVQGFPADQYPAPPVPVRPASQYGNRRRRRKGTANDNRSRPQPGDKAPQEKTQEKRGCSDQQCGPGHQMFFRINATLRPCGVSGWVLLARAAPPRIPRK